MLHHKIFISLLTSSLLFSGYALAQEQHKQMMNHKMPEQNNMHMMMQETTLQEYIKLPTNEPLKPLALVKNTSKKAGVFEATLTAKPTDVTLATGQSTQFWLYNDTLLPVIDTQVGTQVNIKLNNQLPQETTIHWHGLSIPADQDGNPQDPVAIKQSHMYQFKLTQNMAGSHWFHPHTHKATAEQVYRGLAGLFIVRDPNDPLRDIPEQNLFISDLKLDPNGQIAPSSMMDRMNGREGQYTLINGQKQPEISLNGTQRWRIWNGNSARYLNLNFPEDQVEAYLVSNDGGLLETPQAINTILLTPGERAEIVLTPKHTGHFNLTALAYDRQKMGNVPPEKDLILGQVKMQNGQTITLPKKLRTIADFGTPTVKRQLTYSEEHMNFFINGKEHDMNRIDIHTKVGQVEEWEIYNNSHMDHNFHLHGTHFLVKEFEQNGQIKKPEYKMLKDTINLKPYEKARIITVQNQKGIRMYHCHILEHEDAGMMGQLEAK
ncbi:multicopper oxidase family protein [Neisseria sp. Ec49-e6-T10]|uniref:multicopper oxidase family protein n=1 Tax=Neisseria sp. Ec49-e6-T10 TaxID=3140744 RepID=UPI003EB93E18